MNEYRKRQLLDEARYFEQHGMWLHAVQVYQRLIEESPDVFEYRVRLGMVYLEMGNFTASEKVLLHALRHSPNDPDVLYALGVMCYQSDELDRALFYLQQLARFRLPKVHYSLGLVHWRKGNPDHAERHFRIVLEKEPTDTDAAVALGEVCLLTGKPKQAMDVLAAAALRNPHDASLQFTLATAAVAAQTWDAAIEAYNSVLRLQPENLTASIALGGACLRARRFDEAEQVFRSLLLKDTRCIGALMGMARLCMLKANRSRAEEYLRQVLLIDPDHEEALEEIRYFTPYGKPQT